MFFKHNCQFYLCFQEHLWGLRIKLTCVESPAMVIPSWVTLGKLHMSCKLAHPLFHGKKMESAVQKYPALSIK